MECKYFLKQHVTMYNGQWYCYLCNIILPNSNEVNRHLKDAHSPVSIQISNFLNETKLSNQKYEELVNQGIVIRKFEQDYFCLYCLSSISSLCDFPEYLKKGNSHRCTGSMLLGSQNKQQSSNDTSSEQSNTSVNTNNPMEHINESNLVAKVQSVNEKKLMKGSSNNSTQIANETIASVPYVLMQEAKMYKHFSMQHTIHYGQWYCHLCKSMLQSLADVTCHLQEVHPNSGTQISDFLNKSIELSDTNEESLSHEIAMQDIPQNYFCAPCQCSLPSLEHFYEHSIGKIHKRMIQCNKKYLNANTVLKDSADKEQSLNNDTIDNKNVSVNVLDKNNLIKNLSNFKVEEESTVSSKSSNKDNISDILQTEGYDIFCCLCDMFVYKTTTTNHIIKSRIHEKREFALKIFTHQTSYIIKLEKEKKIFKTLQLNSKKFDGTIWPEYTEIAAKYTCDQCNKMIEEDDIINHEITVHKSGMISSIKFIYDGSLMKKDFNVVTYYPLFKCSFCNEIIHGMLLLQAHFSKYKHEENIKSLIDIKRREYDSCKNIQIYLEPLEFLNLISFENNDGTVQIQEQPVIYIKNHYITLCKNAVKMQKKFIYICFDCPFDCIFDETQTVIEHLGKELIHLKQFQNIFLTYKYIHNVSTSRELNESEHEVKPPVTKDVSIDNESLKECTIDKILVNTEHCNDSLIAEVNTCDKNNGLCQNEENNSSFFVSLDVFVEINKLITTFNSTSSSNVMNQQLCTEFNNSNAVDRYNKIYKKEFLDFEEIMFTCNKRKLKEIKLNLQFFLPHLDEMLCILCVGFQLCNVQTIYEHITSEKHNIQFRQLCQNKNYFKLLKELIKVQSTYVNCFACESKMSRYWNGKYINNYNYHINLPSHKENRKRLLIQTECFLEKYQNLWYGIQYFACVDCKQRFKMKIKFMEHLDDNHRTVLINKDNSMFDFCLTCATLWYNSQSHTKDNIKTYHQLHCQLQMHQYLKKNNDFAVTSLPQPLLDMLRNVNGISVQLFKLSEDTLNDPKVTQLTDALKHIFETHQLPVEVCTFGSRVTGLALTNSDIDVYLNFGDECTEPESIKRKSKQIRDCLRTDHENWDIELTLDRSRTPIIKVKHRSTGLQCDISFMNSLSVENSKFIRSFNIAYPSCQKLTLFLKKWLLLGGLTGLDGITNYALVWLVIFYLQVNFKIRNIAALIESHNKSKIVSGWEIEVDDTVLINAPISELLLGFFKYYGNFNYWHLIICPLLGKACPKKAFIEVSLPSSMAPYIAQLHNNKPEYFRVDSPMCVQDPFDLSHNLTKAVTVLTLNRFKHYCNESLPVLRSVIGSSHLKNRLSH